MKSEGIIIDKRKKTIILFLGLITSWYLFASTAISEPGIVKVPISSELEKYAQERGIIVVRDSDVNVAGGTVHTVSNMQEFLSVAEKNPNVRYALLEINGAVIKRYTVFALGDTYVWDEKYSYSPSSYAAKIPRYEIAGMTEKEIVYKKDQARSMILIGLSVVADMFVIYCFWGLLVSLSEKKRSRAYRHSED